MVKANITNTCAANGTIDKLPAAISRREFAITAACGIGVIALPILAGCRISFPNAARENAVQEGARQEAEQALESEMQEDTRTLESPSASNAAPTSSPNAKQDGAQALKDPVVGGTVDFGDLSWKVLDVRDGKALLITEDIVELRAYNDAFTDATWKTCSLRAYLNGEFLSQHFSAAERERIVLADVKNDDDAEYGISGGNSTRDKLFLLSVDEAYSYFASDTARRAARYQGSVVGWWWLRSPGSHTRSAAAYVDLNGSVYANGHYVYAGYGVRPALWLNL